MSFEIIPGTEQDIENMLNSYIEKVITNEKKKFDNKSRTLLRREELSLNPYAYNYILNDAKTMDYTFDVYEETAIGFSNIEAVFTNKKLYLIVKKLKPVQKKILYLIYISGMPEKEIAAKLNVTRQCVNSIKNRSLKKIIEIYNKKEVS